MSVEPSVYIGDDAPGALCGFAREQALGAFDLLADVNTWEALGQRTAARLSEAGCVVHPIILSEGVIADEDGIVQVLLQTSEPDRALVAVGSGTLTDIGRFVTHRANRVFISMPTAPSVDAYSSINSPLVVRRLKQTINAHAPGGIYADLGVLCAAPPEMIAAGYGDILAKFTCLADWRLAQLLWGEELDEDVERRMHAALASVAPQAAAIGRAEPLGIEALMRALLDSGDAMAAVGSSRPASGAEHHISHFLEMRLLLQARPPVLHGAKVGAATVLMARSYQRLREMTRAQMQRSIAQDAWPSAEAQRAEIRASYGGIADQVIASHRAFIEIGPEERERFYARVVDNWGAIQGIAAGVPPAETLAHWLSQAGGTVDLTSLGFGADEVALAARSAHYIRSRFTIRDLELALGLEALHHPGLCLE